jgi:DNA-binding XRE family transcriptional regulator
MDSRLNALTHFAKDINPPVVKQEFLAVIHKLKYPMADILAKIPGETTAERARAIGVARQTMYVWVEERFRPAAAQAQKIAKLTGVPIEQILALPLWDGQNDPGRKVAKKTGALAAGGKTAPEIDGRLGRGKRRVVIAQSRSGKLRTVRERTRG